MSSYNELRLRFLSLSGGGFEQDVARRPDKLASHRACNQHIVRTGINADTQSEAGVLSRGEGYCRAAAISG